jgi:hypothetical protein
MLLFLNSVRNNQYKVTVLESRGFVKQWGAEGAAAKFAKKKTPRPGGVGAKRFRVGLVTLHQDSRLNTRMSRS